MPLKFSARNILVNLILSNCCAALNPISFHSDGNPILSDGSYFTADPAPLVANNTLYIFTGHDTAAPDENAFIMPNWQMLVSNSPNPTGADWTLYPDIVRPETLFAWAAQGTAYASQMVQGIDGKFYLYSPVTLANSNASDHFAIGVAVSDDPLGPYVDAHPSGPIISQDTPAPGNHIQNIDPTVIVDDDQRVYIYWGTFGQLRGYELDSDMVTIQSSSLVEVNSLTGFFEAPWIMKRKGVYYLMYAANNAGPESLCTPTSYHACIAYGTASAPLGPWTFQGVILDIVSSTTSHPGAVEMDGTWYLVYHNADAEGGGHFRRSVAIDIMAWDDSKSPPLIKKVEQSHRLQASSGYNGNIAPKAAASSDRVVPIQYWIKSLNDDIVRTNPLPPDYWSNYDGDNPPQQSILTYTWNKTVELNSTSMVFFADHPVGSSDGIAPPMAWHVEYLDVLGGWKRVNNNGLYPLSVTDQPAIVDFLPVNTTALRATLAASGSGSMFAGVAVKEWRVFGVY